MANLAMLGTGLIGLFYTMSLTGKRSRDKVVVVQGRDPEKTKAFAEKHGIPRSTTSRGRPRLPQVPRADEAARHGGRPGQRRPLPGAVGEATEVPRRSPGRGPPHGKSRVLRRQALGEEDDAQGRWVQETA
jgi:hypothetical protein